MLNIAKASIKFQWPSWAVYDQNFRIEAANTPAMDWSKVDPIIHNASATWQNQQQAGAKCAIPSITALKTA